MQGVARNSFLLTDISESERAILSAVRVRIDADLTDNVSTTVRLLNERLWGDEADTNNETRINLDLAYATMKEFLYSPLTLVVGRQELRYGNALIIGDVDTNARSTSNASALPSTLTDLSLRKSFDAIKAVLNYDPLTIDLVGAQIEENTTTAADDVTLMGINANYVVNKNLTTEAYLWSRDRQAGSTGITIADAANGERLNTVGARGVYTGIKNLILGLEGAYQFGDHVDSNTLYVNDSVRTPNLKYKHSAYGVQANAMYMMPDRKYTPSVSMSLTQLSGDKDLNNNGTYKGWDAMYEDQAAGTIFNKIVGFSNCRLLNLGGSMKPMDDVTVKLDWYHLRLLQPFSDPAGGTSVVSRILSGVSGASNVRTGKRQ
jgi:hypothetical protein